MQNSKTRDITYMAIYIAMAVVLELSEEFIPLFKMPNGGNLCIAIIPIILASYQLGAKKGMLCGFIWWITTTIFGQNAYIVSFWQMLLDYLIPAMLCGAASAFPKIKKISNVYIGSVSIILLRYICFVISGAVFWFPKGSSAGSLAAWIYSLNYNLYYNLATGIVAVIVVGIVIKRFNNESKIQFKFVK